MNHISVNRVFLPRDKLFFGRDETSTVFKREVKAFFYPNVEATFDVILCTFMAYRKKSETVRCEIKKSLEWSVSSQVMSSSLCLSLPFHRVDVIRFIPRLF